MLLRVIYLEQGVLILFLYCLHYGWIEVRSLYKSLRFPNSPAHFSCVFLSIERDVDMCLPLTCVTLELLLENSSSDEIPSRVFSQPGMREAGEVWTNRETREQNTFPVAREVHSRKIRHEFESRRDC